MNRKMFLAAVALFAAGVVAAVPMRVIELLHYIDPKTGFYNGGNALVAALNALLIVLTLLLLAPLFLRRGTPEAPVRHSLSGAVLCFIIAALFLIYGLGQLALLAVLTQISCFWEFLTALLAAIFFFLLGRVRLGARIALKAPALFPLAWGIVILIASFMQYTAITNISKSLFDVLKMVFVMLFLYYHALTVGFPGERRSVNGLIAFGLTGVFYIFLTTLPKIFLLPAHSDNAGTLIVTDILYLGLAVYILFLLFEIYFPKAKLFHPGFRKAPAKPDALPDGAGNERDDKASAPRDERAQ